MGAWKCARDSASFVSYENILFSPLQEVVLIIPRPSAVASPPACAPLGFAQSPGRAVLVVPPPGLPALPPQPTTGKDTYSG